MTVGHQLRKRIHSIDIVGARNIEQYNCLLTPSWHNLNKDMFGKLFLLQCAHEMVILPRDVQDWLEIKPFARRWHA